MLADLLNRSTILAGAGCAGAHAELVELAGKLQAPIVHALRGNEFIEHDNPLDVGMTGLLGFASGYYPRYYPMMSCYLWLMVGTGHFHLRRRNSDDLGRAVSHHEWQKKITLLAAHIEAALPWLLRCLSRAWSSRCSPTITGDEAKGFTLFMMKAVLGGRCDEIIDLAHQPPQESPQVVGGAERIRTAE
jgi:hypothetical protein